MYRSFTIAALAALVASASAQSSSGIKLTEIDLYQFSLNGKPQDIATLYFPRLEFTIFGLNTKTSTFWVDYYVKTVKGKNYSINFGTTASIASGRGTGGVWVNPSFQMGRTSLGGSWYYLMDDRGRTSQFAPNLRLQYELGQFTFGPEAVAYTDSQGWHHRNGATVKWDINHSYSLRFSWLKGSGGSELHIFANVRF